MKKLLVCQHVPHEILGTLNPLLKRAGFRIRLKQKIYQWHEVTFDIPKSAVHLAFSRVCVSQSFRYGANVYGLQFHLEVDERISHRLLKVSENRQKIAGLEGIDPEQIHRET